MSGEEGRGRTVTHTTFGARESDERGEKVPSGEEGRERTVTHATFGARESDERGEMALSATSRPAVRVQRPHASLDRSRGEITVYATSPPQRTRASMPDPPSLGHRLLGWWTWRRLPGALAALVVLAALAFLGFGPALPVVDPVSGHASVLEPAGRVTLAIFTVAVWTWAFTPLDDTYTALGAGVALVLCGVVSADALFDTLGDDTIWLLVGAFVLAVGVTTSGLATRCAAWLVSGEGSTRYLVHLVTTALVVTTYAVPATSGRAALVLPVFAAIAAVVTEHGGGGEDGSDRRIVRALSLLFPTVILLSAVGSLVGAGAHLVTSRVVQTATGTGFSFAGWLMLGLPLAFVSSHLAAELILRLFCSPADRRRRLRITVADMQRHVETPVSGPLTVLEGRAALLIVAVVVLWCTESLHGVHPAVVALVGGLIATSPRYGSITLKKSLGKVPWSLLLFMAATLALGDALITSGAADWVARAVFGGLGVTTPVPFLVVTIVVSTLAHLVIQSRSARSAVLVPIVVAMAPTMGVAPAAAAFASTAAAGFCHTLPSSAKPVALFSDVPGIPTYEPADLRRLSLVLGPLTAALVLVFSLYVWPLLGLPL